MSPRRRGSAMRRATHWVLGIATAAWLVLLVGWLSLHWLILPHIESWRRPIEARASQLLGAPVRLGTIIVTSGGWVPHIEMRDVQVLDPQRRTALVLPRVVAALSARSLLAFDLRLSQLYIESPRLEIRRDAAGRIRVAGLDFGAGDSAAADGGSVADWCFAQDELVIRAGTVRWIDEARAAPPLELVGVDFVLRNGLRSHDVRLDATPPPDWGDRFSLRGRFSQPLLARAGDWRRWSGEAYVELPRADLRELRRHVTLPFELAEGDGALRGWFEVRDGRPRAATVDVALRRVALRFDPGVEPLGFEQVAGRIVARRDGEQTSVAVQHFGFSMGHGLRWPDGDLAVAWRQRDGEAVSGGEFSAERLDVGLIADVAGGVPIGAALRTLLADVDPKGVVTRLKTSWEGPLDAPTRYRVAGTLSGLSLTARAAAKADAVGRPGLRNATIELDASEAGGRATIGVRDGVLEVPGVFADAALPLERFGATLDWRIDRSGPAGAPPITVRVRDATFGNADVHGDFTASWRTGAGDGAALGRGARYPGVLELDGRLADADAGRAGRYLPLGLPDEVRRYVARAVRGGKVPRATIRVRGDLHDFPFHHARTPAEGEFRLAAHVEGLELAYLPSQPAWPVLTAGRGDLVVDGATLALRDATATIGGVEWRGLEGGIAAFDDKARFDVSGQARAPLAELLRVVATTPVGRWIDGVLDETTATGTGELRLALSIPLAGGLPATVKGSLALGGNDVRVRAATPLLAGARGRVEFTESSFALVAASARLLGGDVSFDGGARPGEPPRFAAHGTVAVEALRGAEELGSLARYASALAGQAAYRATLSFASGRPQLSFASDLVGVAVDLPAPIGKAAATASPLRVRTAIGDAPAGGALASAASPVAASTDTVLVELGSHLRARIVRDAATGRVLRGALRLADTVDATRVADAATLPLPASGVAASIDLQQLDIDAWQAAADRLVGGPTAGAGAAPPALDVAGSGGDAPTSVALRAGVVTQGGRRFHRVAATASQQGATWRADIDADELAGHVEYRPAGAGGSATGRTAQAQARLYARLSRLSLPRGDADAAEAPADRSPATLPALDIVVDDFVLRGKQLGRLEVAAQNQPGERRVWRVSTFDLTMPEGKLTANGTWSAPGPASTRRTEMDFDLAVSDSGALLDRLGVAGAVRGGRGRLSGSLGWPGSPLSPDTATMHARVHLAVDAGQFLKASAGAGRLLGVLSLQSLPRRLLLDFRDLFQEGFAFDNVTGDVAVADGVASTNNLRMRGAAAAVLMEGSADLERETQDLRVVVVPEINAGTASLAFAIINPAVGLGTFLAQYLLSKPIAEASTREFRVTGPWDDPKVERVERGVATLSDAASASVPR